MIHNYYLILTIIDHLVGVLGFWGFGVLGVALARSVCGWVERLGRRGAGERGGVAGVQHESERLKREIKIDEGGTRGAHSTSR